VKPEGGAEIRRYVWEKISFARISVFSESRISHSHSVLSTLTVSNDRVFPYVSTVDIVQVICQVRCAGLRRKESEPQRL
jgi:hypothetical protein